MKGKEVKREPRSQKRAKTVVMWTSRPSQPKVRKTRVVALAGGSLRGNVHPPVFIQRIQENTELVKSVESLARPAREAQSSQKLRGKHCIRGCCGRSRS